MKSIDVEKLHEIEAGKDAKVVVAQLGCIAAGLTAGLANPLFGLWLGYTCSFFVERYT
ncbi:MAG TPA: hypothetical protein PKJ08_09745 [Candidatus Cloacimonadota bacterium]|nr:hypothetical protein [Candidatus Cloacimonadota bacterium]HPM02863.1 hypothetical protein [Candidatus Cloacimonadota bacterium]